jgi:tRNA1(Val) A37 N6-methylase TrmN6
MDLYENERIDFVNDDLSLIQRTDGLTFGTDALLLAAYVSARYSSGLELGAGTGIISMLLLKRKKCESVTALEVQSEYAELTERNAHLNGLTDKLTSICKDVREYTGEKEFSLVFSNPPYMKVNAGKRNEGDAKYIARHEVMGDIFDFLAAAKRNLKYGGDFYCVYRPDRLIDLIFAMRRCGIEPKRITPVMANSESEVSTVLVMARRGAGVSLRLTRPLIIYDSTENKDYTPDMNYIMENGSFPTDFIR